LRLSTVHYAQGREYDPVATIGLRRAAFPHYRAKRVDAEKRLFHVGVTRARQFLVYVAERDSYGNPASMFLGPEGVNILLRHTDASRQIGFRILTNF
jgi:DNA helicase II / ATP-dependent DNA helicase PcrA